MDDNFEPEERLPEDNLPSCRDLIKYGRYLQRKNKEERKKILDLKNHEIGKTNLFKYFFDQK